MKNKFLTLAFLFVCMLCVPLFVACTGEGASDIKGVSFTKDVFEVDLNTPINLTYKTYPSTAKDYNVTFDFKVDSANSQQMYLYQRPNKFTIINNLCPDVVARIDVGEFHDTCTIRLKQYPTQLRFNNSEPVKVNAGGVYSLPLQGLFVTRDRDTGAETREYKNLDILNYNIEVTSDNPSVLAVDQTNPLNILSTGQSGKATITAKIKNMSGKYISAQFVGELSASMQISVIDNVSSAVVCLSGEQEFLNLSVNSFTQGESNTYYTSYSQVTLSVSMFSDGDKLITGSGVTVDVHSSNPSVAQVVKSADTVSKNFTINLLSSGTARLQISSSATDKDGNPVIFVFYIVK